jgi:hypothetical protein
MKEPKRGAGTFQWNLGGWFGAQIGSTLWLFIMGGILVSKDLVPGLVVIGCGLAPNLLGFLLWGRRDRIAPYTAIQTLFLVMGLCTLLAFIAIDSSGRVGELDPSMKSPRHMYWMLLIFPALMGLFHFHERAGKRKRL